MIAVRQEKLKMENPIYSYGKNITLTVNGNKKKFDLTTNSHQPDPNNTGLGCVGFSVEDGITIGDWRKLK